MQGAGEAINWDSKDAMFTELNSFATIETARQIKVTWINWCELLNSMVQYHSGWHIFAWRNSLGRSNSKLPVFCQVSTGHRPLSVRSLGKWRLATNPGTCVWQNSVDYLELIEITWWLGQGWRSSSAGWCCMGSSDSGTSKSRGNLAAMGWTTHFLMGNIKGKATFPVKLHTFWFLELLHHPIKQGDYMRLHLLHHDGWKESLFATLFVFQARRLKASKRKSAEACKRVMYEFLWRSFSIGRSKLLTPNWWNTTPNLCFFFFGTRTFEANPTVVDPYASKNAVVV